MPRSAEPAPESAAESAAQAPAEAPAEAPAGLAARFAAVTHAVDAATAGGRTPVILIDGPSGAGKSSLADLLLAAWPAKGHPRLVRMDDLYPGWDGLDAASTAVADDLLEPLRASRAGSWQRWDWAEDRPAGRETVTGPEPLIVEGCGTLSVRNAALAYLTVWLGADDTLRKQRALARDGDTFATHWDTWQAEFDRFVAREHPLDHAALILDVSALDLSAGVRDRRSGTTVDT
ncbi:MAG: ATP-binding protein [Leifsonia sp.]